MRQKYVCYFLPHFVKHFRHKKFSMPLDVRRTRWTTRNLTCGLFIHPLSRARDNWVQAPPALVLVAICTRFACCFASRLRELWAVLTCTRCQVQHRNQSTSCFEAKRRLAPRGNADRALARAVEASNIRDQFEIRLDRNDFTCVARKDFFARQDGKFQACFSYVKIRIP